MTLGLVKLDGATEVSSGGPGGIDAPDSYYLLQSNTDYTYTLPREITEGKVAVEFWYKDNSNSFGVANTNCNVFIIDESSSIGSAASRAALFFKREDATDASTLITEYRDSGSFPEISGYQARNQWRKMKVVIDIDNDLYAVHLNGAKAADRIATPSTTGGIKRVIFRMQSAAPDFQVAGLQVYTGETDSLTPAIDQDFRDDSIDIDNLLVNSTDAVTRYPQKWLQPTKSDISKFTPSATGLVPHASNNSLMLAKTSPSGVWEVSFKTSDSGSDNNYIGLLFNCFEGNNSANSSSGYILFRYSDSSANKIELIQGGTTVDDSVNPSGVTIGADEEHVLRVTRIDGSDYILCEIDDQIQFGGWVQVNSTLMDRGLEVERTAGVVVSGSLGNENLRVTGFRHWTSESRHTERTMDVGDFVYKFSTTNIGEIYYKDQKQSITVGSSKQFGHTEGAQGDKKPVFIVDDLVNTALCKAYQLEGSCGNSDREDGRATVNYTAVAHKFHAVDSLLSYTGSVGWKVDNDYDPNRMISNGSLYIGAGGSAATLNPLTTGAWTQRYAGNYPCGVQNVVEFDDGSAMRVSCIYKDIAGPTTGAIVTKNDGACGSFSAALGANSSEVTIGSTHTAQIAYLYEPLTSAAISSQVLEDLRDDVANPVDYTVNTGSLKTDETGDIDSDGFDETHGWLVITASSGTIRLTNGSYTRKQPVYRIYGVADTIAVSVNGTDLQTDQYVVQKIDDSSTVVALLVDVQSGERVDIAGASVTVGGSTLASDVTDWAGDIEKISTDTHQMIDGKIYLKA